MEISFKYLIITGLFISAFSGCKNGGGTELAPIPDATKPTISIVKPTAGQSFITGNTITFQATFSDNEKLKNYEIAINKLVLGSLTLKNVPNPIDWSYVKLLANFSSGVKQQEINLNDIAIPLTINTNPFATGKYNFKVTCVDASNNISVTTIEININ